MLQKLQKFSKFKKIQLDNLVDVEKCCKTHIFFSARSFNEVGKTGKEERKSKNENTRLGR